MSVLRWLPCATLGTILRERKVFADGLQQHARHDG